MVVDSITEILVWFLASDLEFQRSGCKSGKNIQVRVLTAVIRHQASVHIFDLVGHASHLDTPSSGRETLGVH